MVGSDSWSTVVSALDPQSVFGSSLVLVRFGDNPDLRAEDASSFTLSASYTPPSLSGLQLAASYFALSASGRPAAVPYTYNLLNDPAYASVITRNPSAQLLEDVCDADDISDASLLACRDVDAPIAAIADLRTQNTVGQKTRGVDFTGRYSFNTVRGAPTIGLMGTYVFDYLVSAHVGEPYVERVNMQHNPLALRFRASLHWKPSSFGGGAYLNFASAYRDDASLPERPVSQWTTMDLQVFYESDPWGADAFSLRVALDVLNAFNEPPPFLNNPVGVGYDQENGDLRGRMALLTVRARF
jgi:outer membrane receptor protein involved in Fe transport